MARTAWTPDPKPVIKFMGLWARFHVISLFSEPWTSFPTYSNVYASPFARGLLPTIKVSSVLYSLFPCVDYASSPVCTRYRYSNCDTCRRYLYVSEHASNMKK
jgi:hypothetical protein